MDSFYSKPTVRSSLLLAFLNDFCRAQFLTFLHHGYREAVLAPKKISVKMIKNLELLKQLKLIQWLLLNRNLFVIIAK